MKSGGKRPGIGTGHLRTRNCLKSPVPVFDCSRSSAECALSKLTDSAGRPVPLMSHIAILKPQTLWKPPDARSPRRKRPWATHWSRRAVLVRHQKAHRPPPFSPSRTWLTVADCRATLLPATTAVKPPFAPCRFPGQLWSTHAPAYPTIVTSGVTPCGSVTGILSATFASPPRPRTLARLIQFSLSPRQVGMGRQHPAQLDESPLEVTNCDFKLSNSSRVR